MSPSFSSRSVRPSPSGAASSAGPGPWSWSIGSVTAWSCSLIAVLRFTASYGWGGSSGPRLLLAALALPLLLALLARLALGLLPLRRSLLRHGLGGACRGPGLGNRRPVAGGLGGVALLLGRERRGPGRRVVADHVELLAHRPQVGGGPVEEHA